MGKKNKNLYFVYMAAWRNEKVAEYYDLTPAASLIFRAIIDEVNALFWPKTPVRIRFSYFRDTCNIKSQSTVKKARDQLIAAGLIAWHPDKANNNNAGFYKITWVPEKLRNIRVAGTSKVMPFDKFAKD